MNQKFIFIFTLLAALLTVNAIPFQKRKTEFIVCPGSPDGVFNVKMNPDPVILGQNVTFDIFATVTDDVGDNGSVVVDFNDANDDSLLSQSFDLPSVIKAHSAINDSFSMPVKLSSLPEGYYIQISVISHTNGGPFKEVACAITS
ncbi:34841_t:CDS:1 [Racocetra persica]|uniref:34841_t:CDS:1 n=1 Tax=Racocetra persica TaxID=160502 RepID=A0ACA9LUB5_9GLOM|nr:34841_t:CDS:1 [Racocetra persica]